MSNAKGYIIGQAINIQADDFRFYNRDIIDHREDFVSKVLSTIRIIEEIYEESEEPKPAVLPVVNDVENLLEHFFIVKVESTKEIDFQGQKIKQYNYRILLGDEKAVRFANSFKSLAINTDYFMKLKRTDNKKNPKFPYLEIV